MKTKLVLSSIFLMASLQMSAQSLDSAQWFDFWVGHWEATWDEGNGKKGKGINKITKELDGKVIQESFEILEGQSKGFKGMSLSVFNPRQNVWRQSWADNQGGYFSFYGEKKGDKKIFKTVVVEKDDKKIVQRMVFYNIKKDSFTWDWESSQDGGESWKLLWQISYSRKKS